MGRRRSVHHGLPPHMGQKGRRYYYVTNDKPRKWLPLGDDYALALIQWAKHEGQPVPEDARTLTQIAAWYWKDVIPGKKPRTRKDNKRELERLEAVFGASPIETIEPADVRTYLDSRMDMKTGLKPARTRANREISLLSHIINFARERGFTAMANPCAGIDRHREKGRDRYADDAEFDALYAAGDELLRDAMDLLLFTSQRPGDVIRFKRTDIRDGALGVTQGKTGHKERIELVGEFGAAVERMLGRPRKATSVYLVADERGQPLTYWQLEDRFSKARVKAALALPSVADIQMRDIRGKAATDAEDLAHAQKLLGHKSRAMTERYVKQRAGERVMPLTRKRRKL